MIVYHPLPLYFHFIKLLLTFFLFPAVMADKTSYRTFFRPVFLLRTVQAVGKKPKPQMVDINYRQSFWRSYK
jgi:hypothetical protein